MAQLYDKDFPADLHRAVAHLAIDLDMTARDLYRLLVREALDARLAGHNKLSEVSTTSKPARKPRATPSAKLQQQLTRSLATAEPTPAT